MMQFFKNKDSEKLVNIGIDENLEINIDVEEGYEDVFVDFVIAYFGEDILQGALKNVANTHPELKESCEMGQKMVNNISRDFQEPQVIKPSETFRATTNKFGGV